MALKTTHGEEKFGVGDKVRVTQKVEESGKSRASVFEGMVIGIKGRNSGKTFTVRRIGSQGIGIERIFPIASPTIEKVEVVRKGVRGVRHAKLYFTRDKSTREVDDIYRKAAKKEAFKNEKPKTTKKKVNAPKKQS